MSSTDTRAPKGNILVVDDTHDNLRLLNGILTKQGYSVRPVPDGGLAIVSAQKAHPDLILLDIMMPTMSGYEVCERLKADEQTREIPIIFISALNEAFDKVKAFGLGGVDYITKPFQVEEVVARVETHLMLRNLHKELQTNNLQLQKEIGERIQAEKSLKDSLIQIERAKREWESTADALAYVVCLLDEHGRILRSNRTIELWDLSNVLDIKGKGLHDVFHPDCTELNCYLLTFLAENWERVAAGQQAECEARDTILQRYLHVQLRPMIEQQKPPETPSGSFAVCCLHDITKRKQAEELLRQRNYELAAINQMSSLLQACHTEEETYQVLASVCKELFPEDAGCLYMAARPQSELKAAITWGNFPGVVQGFTIDECWCLCNNTSFLVSQPGESPLCDHLQTAPPHGYVCVPLETSDFRPGVLQLYFGPPETDLVEKEYRRQVELKRMVVVRLSEHYAMSVANLRLRETLRTESIRDPLTELYNRRYMEESLQREAYRAERNHTAIGIIMLDIDHFKRLNDTYGHKIGDLVLRTLGNVLQKNIRGGDIACRYGGEEFLLILPDAGIEATHKRALELLAHIRTLMIASQETKIQITVSIGVAALTEDTHDIQTVIEAADKAMYQAKQGGRNQVVVAS